MVSTSPDSHARALAHGLIALTAVSAAFGAWGVWRMFTADDAAAAPVADDAGRTRAQAAELEQLRQRVVTLSRSDQISRDANRDLQATLAEREEEIAGLRADVAFYERLVGATSQRRGLNVHALRLQPQGANAWHFTSTLTQNLSRDAVSTGQLTLKVEGTRNGRLERLEWSDLRQQARAPGEAFSFRYFQQVEGDVFLPPGLVPVRVTVRLAPRSGSAVEQSFTWQEATQGAAAAAR